VYLLCIFYFLLLQLHIQSLNQLQQTSAAIARGLEHLSELGVQLLESMSAELEAWCSSVDPEDESSFHNHPVLHREPMSDPLHLIRMHVLSALVRQQNASGCGNLLSARAALGRCGMLALFFCC